MSADWQADGELGYMQDLVWGIGKIIPKAPPVASPASFDGAPGTGGQDTKLRIDEATQTVTGISGPPGVTLVIPSEIKAIAPGAFADTAGIVSVTIEPGNLQSIPERAFAGCRNLESLAIPQSLVSIGDEAFSGCAKLGSIDFSWVTVQGKLRITDTNAACLKSIDARAFAGCDGLSRMAFPDSLESLGNEAFAGCRALEDVYTALAMEISLEQPQVFYEKKPL